MVRLVASVVLHWDGVTELIMGGCTSTAASYAVDALPAAVKTATLPLEAVVSHTSWRWACQCQGVQGEGKGECGESAGCTGYSGAVFVMSKRSPHPRFAHATSHTRAHDNFA